MDPRDEENSRERDAATASTSTSQQPAQIQVPPPAQVPPRPSPISTGPTQIPAQPSPASTVHPQVSIASVRPVRSADRLAEEDPHSPSRGDASRYGNPLPPLPSIGEVRAPPRTRTVDTYHSVNGRPASRLDWIVPVEEKVIPKLSVGERLQPTLTRAHLERDKYAVKAKMTGYALNAAIGMQVLLGSLTTGLAAATTAGKQAAIATTILGGLSTLVASYLARARGSNEPELSITRVKDLEQFIREADAFQLDQGHITTNEHDDKLFRFRDRFEELLGNASGERKLSPIL